MVVALNKRNLLSRGCSLSACFLEVLDEAIATLTAEQVGILI